MKDLFIIGSGESNEILKGRNLKNFNSIVINISYLDFPEANYLFFKDFKFLPRVNGYKGIKEVFRGKVLSAMAPKGKRLGSLQFRNIKLFIYNPNKPLGIETKNKRIVRSMSSGLTAINVAYHLGYRKIYLAGFDGGLKVYENGADIIVEEAKQLNLKIYNLNKHSKIKAFEFIDIENVI